MSVVEWTPGCLEIEVTAACNESCRHCYLGKPLKRQMTNETADSVLKAIRKLSRIGRLTCHLYGGEPFLNFPVVRKLVEAAPKCDWTIFTNGLTAMPWQIVWCKQHGVKARRSAPAKDSRMTRWSVEGKVWEDHAEPHRVVVTPEGVESVFERIQRLHALGFYGMVDLATDDYAEWGQLYQDVYTATLADLAVDFVFQYRNGNMLGIENFVIHGAAMFGGNQKVIGCGAAWQTWGITWDGFVVPCHRFFRAPHDSFAVAGKLSDFNLGLPLRFGGSLTRTIDEWSRGCERDECVPCVARTACRRGCLHVSAVACATLNDQPAHRCHFTRAYAAMASWINQCLSPAKWWERAPTPCESFYREVTYHDGSRNTLAQPDRGVHRRAANEQLRLSRLDQANGQEPRLGEGECGTDNRQAVQGSEAASKSVET